jgi:hypothetical protein
MPIDWGFTTKDSPGYATGARESEAGPSNAYDQYLNQLPMAEDYWRKLGYTGPVLSGTNSEAANQTIAPELLSYIQSRGWQMGTDPQGAMNALIGSDGAPVAGSEYSVDDTGDFMRDAALVAGGGYLGGSALTGTGLFAGGAGVGAGTTAGTAAGTATGATAAEAGGATLLGEAGGYGVAGSAAGSGGGAAAGGSWIPGIANSSVVQGGVGLANTLIQSNANRNAINAQRDAAAQQNALQKAQYDQTRADNAPWRAAGESALAKLSGLLQDGSLSSRFAGKLDNEAGYQFAKQEGMRAVDNSASARGGIGGAALKAGARFAENNANNFYNDAFNRWNTENTGTYNRLSNMAGLGQVANQQVGAAGQNYANQSGNALIGLGNANAAAGINQGNIYGNLLNQGAALGNQYNWWQDARRPDINDKNGP